MLTNVFVSGPLDQWRPRGHEQERRPTRADARSDRGIPASSRKGAARARQTVGVDPSELRKNEYQTVAISQIQEILEAVGVKALVTLTPSVAGLSKHPPGVMNIE
jgi:hypothetical protein